MSESTATPLLGSKAVRELRAKAHSLKPVVWISQKGMSEGALRETDRALTAHELIKIHAALDDRQAREALLREICSALHAQPVQVLGKILVVFRANPALHEKATQLPPAAAGRKTAARKQATRTKTRAAPAAGRTPARSRPTKTR